MAGYFDLNRLNDFTNMGGVGAVATPMMTGGGGNAMTAYLQAAGAGSGGFSSLAPNSGGLSTLSAGSGVTPGPGGPGFFGNGKGLGFNLDTANLMLGGLDSLGKMWMAWQANKLAKDQFKFQKDITNTNLANQISAYNTTLEDRIRSRAAVEGMSAGDAQSYIDSHKLQRRN